MSGFMIFSGAYALEESIASIESFPPPNY